MINTKKLRNGSLYQNSKTGNTTRVLGRINSQRVWTMRHKNQPEATRVKFLDFADNSQVDQYINESKILAV